ncbi:MAG TPA: hypothetical protein VHE60_19160 [Pyrinomonadaceae bacterium]|nr:hypothetical protein [Pyrinomonadaceae bacterium]
MAILFKSDAPVSHRLVFVVAAPLTVKPALDFTGHIGFPLAELLATAPFWFIVLYNWNQRRTWRAQGMSAAEIRAQQNVIGRALDSVQASFDRASVAVRAGYWIAILIAAVAIYKLF